MMRRRMVDTSKCARLRLRRVACWLGLLLTVVMFSLISFAQNGTALQFNTAGPDQGKQFVNLGPNLNLGDPTVNGGAFTIETWFRMDGRGWFSMQEYNTSTPVFAVPL